MSFGLILKAAIPILGVAAVLILSGDVQPAKKGWRSYFADAENLELVVHGKQVYTAQCASCHGRNLQGQPLWRLADENQHLRAPALNGNGSGWMHSDAELFATVAEGHMPTVAPSTKSRMPAFRAPIAHNDILAVQAFMKARWPASLRVAQAAMNPGGAGRPQNLPDDWRFPPICMPGEAPGNMVRTGSPAADPG